MHSRMNHIAIAAALSAISVFFSADAASSPLSVPSKNWYKNRDTCNEFFTKEITRLCTAPAEQWPCFAGSKLVDGKIDHLFKIPSLGSSCCAAGCSELEIREHFCCRTDDCMRKCYGADKKPQEKRTASSSHFYRPAVLQRLRLWNQFYPGARPPTDLMQ